jgi:hypothetical protein
MQSILQRDKAPAQLLEKDQECFVNWLVPKQRCLIEATFRGIPESPLGGVGVYEGYAECFALLRALETKAGNVCFVGVELGAGWGPWVSAVGVVCRKQGVKKIHLAGIAAKRVELNTRSSAAKQRWKPVITSVGSEGIDCRGHSADEKVREYSIPTICDGYSVADLYALDIQSHVAQLCIELSNSLFIWNTGRPIEGGVIKCMQVNLAWLFGVLRSESDDLSMTVRVSAADRWLSCLAVLS